MGHHGNSSSGKYHNSCSKEDVNRGKYGKLSSDQISERIDLHARRMIEGRPTIVEISSLWMAKYNIEMSYQSEKAWCNTPKNKELVAARAEEMKAGGEVALPEMDSAKNLLDSLVETAKQSAHSCKVLKSKLAEVLDEDLSPWGIIGITREEYNSTIGPKKKDYEAKIKHIMQSKKDECDLIRHYSKAHMDVSKEFRSSVKETYEMWKYMGLSETKENKKSLRDAEKAEIQDVTEEEKERGNDLTEVEIEAARESLGYEDN